MREANRRAFIAAAVSVDLGIELLDRFKFSRDGADALRQLSPDDERAIRETFRLVGGMGKLDAERLKEFVVKRLRSDDHLRIDGVEFVVEYDERQHFTTFRASTLDSILHDRLRVGFDRSYYASRCDAARMTPTSGFAHNDSAHRDFECPGGECRHRQRAFYDFLKDVLLGLGLNGIPTLIRISDFETATSANAQAAADLLRRRAGWATRK